MNRLKYVVLILPLKYEMMIWVLMQLRAQGIEWPSWYFPFFLHLTLQYIKSIDLPDLKINIVINKDIFGSPVSGEWGGAGAGIVSVIGTGTGTGTGIEIQK